MGYFIRLPNFGSLSQILFSGETRKGLFLDLLGQVLKLPRENVILLYRRGNWTGERESHILKFPQPVGAEPALVPGWTTSKSKPEKNVLLLAFRNSYSFYISSIAITGLQLSGWKFSWKEAGVVRSQGDRNFNPGSTTSFMLRRAPSWLNALVWLS